MAEKKILYIYLVNTTFVKTDYEILSTSSAVDKYCFVPSKKMISLLTQLVKQLVFLLIKGWKYDAFYIWFGDYHSLLPILFAKLTGKKSYLVVGGYDVCRIPELQYGSFYKTIRGCFTIKSIKYCSVNLTVSTFVDRIVRYIAPKANRKLIYNAVRLNNKTGISEVPKENIILTVGVIPSKQVFLRKGIDTFIETAKLLPQYKFVCVGIRSELLNEMKTTLPANIFFYQKVEQQELVDFYNKAKVYAQFSRMDTFCLTLAEAMTFNCIPVITNIGGMPEVMGNAGFLVKREPEKIAKIIEKVMKDKVAIEEDGASRIAKMFSMAMRKEKLLAHISEI